MNYKKLKPETRLKHIQKHICFVKDYAEAALQNIKLAERDIKFIESVSDSEKTERF